MRSQKDDIKQIGAQVEKLLALNQQLHQREVRAGDSLSVRNDGERELIRQVVRQYRALPEGQRQRLPALLNAVGKLEVVTGEFEAAQHSFEEAAALVPDPAARAYGANIPGVPRRGEGEVLTRA